MLLPSTVSAPPLDSAGDWPLEKLRPHIHTSCLSNTIYRKVNVGFCSSGLRVHVTFLRTQEVSPALIGSHPCFMTDYCGQVLRHTSGISRSGPELLPLSWTQCHSHVSSICRMKWKQPTRHAQHRKPARTGQRGVTHRDLELSTGSGQNVPSGTEYRW